MFPTPMPSESRIRTSSPSEGERAGRHAMESTRVHETYCSQSGVMMDENFPTQKASYSPTPFSLQHFGAYKIESPVRAAECTTIPSSEICSSPASQSPVLGSHGSEVELASQSHASGRESQLGSSPQEMYEHLWVGSPPLTAIPEERAEDAANEPLLNPSSADVSKVSTVNYEASVPGDWSTPAAMIHPIPSDGPLSNPTTLPIPLPLQEAVGVTSTDPNASPLESFQNSPGAGDNDDSSSVVSVNEGASTFSDGDYYSDNSSYTASLLSDVKNYSYENGRRYHSYREGHYVLPNDDQEQDRQDLLHHVRNLVLSGALYRAPLGPDIQRALDIGTGTGIWAIDFADSHPSAEVTGTDLTFLGSPHLRFLVDDAESPWLFNAHRPFDFIHARDLGGAIADWPHLLQQAFTHLRGGGWIELQEFEVTLKSDDESLRRAPVLCEFLGRLHQASEEFHRPMNIAEGHRQRLIEAGFEEVRDEVFKVPSSSWPDDPIQKQIGRYNLCSLLMAVESYSLALFTRVLGWSNTQTQVFLAGVRRDLKNPEVHTYCNLHIVYGRKPNYGRSLD
ncbi:hypothetical protein N7470_001367 [Penicillium chermesinum]|nr:hypothetical protein N7470_001367 [Penicillium chermesinum]